VLSPWWGGATHCQSKESYRIEKDSLIFNSGVMLCPNENVDQEQPGVQFYKMINGKRIIIKSIKGTPEKLEKIFNQSIWNSNDE
jgi:hypothetical protein